MPQQPITSRRTGGGTLLITCRELAALLGLDEETVRRWDAAGKLPAPRLRRRGCTRWSRAEVDAWIEAGCPVRRDWEAMGRSAG